MSRQSDLAFAHNERLISISDLLAKRMRRLWSQMDLRDLNGSWAQVAPRMVAQVNAAQMSAASLSAPYLNAIDRSYRYNPIPASITPAAFSNVMEDGREVGPALFGGVTNTKTLIGRGMAPAMAFQVGANFVAVVASAALHSAAQNADRVLTIGKGYTRYIRVVNGSACSRCAILAGMYSAEEAFQRHISCQCGTAPIQMEGKAKTPAGFHDSPQAYFDSLSAAEQDRRFTVAGAQAIRDGADPIRIVNARRGANGIGYSGHRGAPILDRSRRIEKVTIGYRPNGTAIRVYATAEGSTVRGEFGRQELQTGRAQMRAGARYVSTARVRLMPESIIQIAGDNTALRQAFLRDAGYLDYVPRHGYDNGGKWIQEIRDMRAADRILVNRATARYGNFYLG